MPLSPERFALCEACDQEVAREIAARSDRDRAERIATELRGSGLPRAYRDGVRTWERIREHVPEIEGIFAAAKREHMGLYLWGPAGAWKTSVAAALLAEAIRASGGGRYVFVPSLFAELFAIYAANDGRSSADVIERYAMTEHLVLDDLGKERPSEHAASVLMQIFDGRYVDRRGWMIVTSNFSFDELHTRFDLAGEQFSDPIIRRLTELCISVPMEVRPR